MVEMSPDIVLLCDQDGRILYVNLAGLEMLGLDEHSQLVGRPLEEIIHPDSRAAVAAHLHTLFEGSQEHTLAEGLFLRADGKTIIAEVMGYLFLDGGEFAAHLVIRDVTRRKQAEAAARRARRRLGGAIAAGALVTFAAGGYHVYRHTESVAFCGGSCHSVMGPEYALHQRSSHANVTCAQCHIGEGASWYVKTKLTGIDQVYAVAAGTFPKPIPAPIENLRPASETCEHCHSPQVYHGNRTKLFRSVPEDGDPSDPEVTAVLLRLGGYRAGAYTGIHWHAGEEGRIEYRAEDRKRMRIRELRLTRRGVVTTYTTKGAPLPNNVPWRQMDCSDCHNRIPHNYRTPEDCADDLILSGRLPRLPAIKRASLAALTANYPSREAARDGILANLVSFYHRRGDDVSRLARILYDDAYAPNVYPSLGIRWRTYPNHLGHRDGPGCFRCHDGEHTAADGRTVSQDCELCHSVLVSGSRQSQIDPKMRDLLF
jgi:PAS domain S-box-containing protein